MTDQDLESLRSFYADQRQQLYTYAVSITGHRESAEDAIQQAFQDLLRRSALPGDLRPYLFRCIRNSAIDGMRRAAVRRDSIFARESPEENSASYPAPRTDLAVLFGGLTPDEREAIVLKIHNDLTFQQIADVRGVSLATAASWYRRGLEKMKSVIMETPHERP